MEPTQPQAEVTLEGWESFNAAVHLASLSAGQRLARERRECEVAAGGGCASAGCSSCGPSSVKQALGRLFKMG